MSKHSIRIGSAPGRAPRAGPRAPRPALAAALARSRSWSRASTALRWASSRRRRFSPRSATRTSSGPPRRSRAPRAARSRPASSREHEQRAGSRRRRRSTGRMNSSATSAGSRSAGVVEVERLAVDEDAVADLEDLGVGVAPARPRRRSASTVPTEPPATAGARTASGPPAAGCGAARRSSNALLGGRLQHLPLELALDVGGSARRGSRPPRR